MSFSIASRDPASVLPVVKADVFYSADIARARTDLIDPSRNFMPLERTMVSIHDARGMKDELDLEKQGFMLLRHESEFVGHQNIGDVENLYHEETAKVIRDISGADLVLPHRQYMQVRQPFSGDSDVDWFKAPSLLVHADFTQDVFLKLAGSVQDAEDIEPVTYTRVALYQCWRPLSQSPQDFPLAFTDARSVQPGDYVVMDNIIGSEDVPGNILETRLGRPDVNHKWYYFSGMTPEEIILFKGNDTAFGDMQTVLHTAFDNRANETNSIPRQSIETRFFAFWR